MRLIDSRRLTGPNLYSDAPGAIAEIEWDPGDDPARAEALWRGELLRMLKALRWMGVEVYARTHRIGAALFFTAPIDALLPATEINEWAVASALSLLSGGAESALEPARTVIADAIAACRKPVLAALAGRAAAFRLPLLIDDERVTIGAGRYLLEIDPGAMPEARDVAWSTLASIPVALVSGTNGKTTTTRLVARMARMAGLRVGNSSSDGVSIQEQLVTRGDWSGPDAARLVLRHPDVEFAVLEIARGGILRRGLAVSMCDAALITNVTIDHLGSYGVDDLATMARVKLVIARNARVVVLNADDPELVRCANRLSARIVWFGRDAANPVIDAHRKRGGEAWFVRGDELVHARGSDEQSLIAIAQVPLTFGGSAPYNVENALAAAALAVAMGLPKPAIIAALRAFTSSVDDNPGRGNVLELRGVRIIIDFGHNPAAVRGVLGLARALLGSGRLHVVIGLPGDRPDSELLQIARELRAAQPSAVYLVELTGYLRGRQPGEVPQLLREELISAALPAEALHHADGEVAGLEQALSAAHSGDLILVLPHVDDEVYAMLERRRDSPP